MENQIGQLDVSKKTETNDAPAHMWKTSLGRAVFGFYVETRSNPYFVNDDYLQSLCNVQLVAENNLGKISIFGLIVSVLSIATAHGAIDGASYMGLNVSQIPYLTEFCCLVLSIFVALTVHLQLDIFAISRMRAELFSTTGSENPNMRMVHLKGSGAWVDALIPKQIGYSSNVFHRAIQLFGLCWSMALPLALVSIVLVGQLICIVSVWSGSSSYWSDLILWMSILISASSMVLVLLVGFVPLKFKLKQQPKDKQ